MSGNPAMPAIDASSAAGSTSAVCPGCGTKLSGGACPACALGFLLHGSDDPDPDRLDRRVEENVEFGRYTLKHKLAAGGMGIVYVAEDRKLKRTVALKMIRGSTFADEGEVARFTLEAEAAAALDHPNIVPIYEVGRMDGQPFFTMKLIEGTTLARRLKEHGGILSPREVATLLSKISRAVHHAHQRGVLHRDLKPGNILLDAEGIPWLTDFGLAKLSNADSGLTLTRDHIGTPHYMAPEVAGGNARAVSTGSDVWALGVMLWEMLCGMPPFHGPGPMEIMRRIVAEEPSWPAGTRADGDLVTIARRCMEKNPARRPHSAEEVADELDRWLRGEPIKARRVTQRERFVKWVRREPAMAALYGVMVIAFFTGLYLWQRAEHAVVTLTKTNDRMEESLRTATATKLAGDARLQVQEDPNRALLLAVESVKMTEPAGVLPEAASALMTVLSKAGGWDASQGSLRGAYSEALLDFKDFHRRAAAISPDGRWLLSLNTERWGEKPTPAAVFDLHDEMDTRPLRQWHIWDACNNIEVPAGCWLPDSRRVLTVNGGGRVRIWSVITKGGDEGGGDSSVPETEECGTLPLRKDMNLITIKPRVTAGSMGVMWMERTDAPVPGGAPPAARIARAGISAEGVHVEAECMVSGPWANHLSFAAAPGGDRGLVYNHRGMAPPFLADLSGSTAVQHPLILPNNCVVTAVFDHAERHLAVQLEDNTVYCGLVPEPGAASREITLRHVLTYPARVRRIALSPDGRWLAATGDSSLIQIAPLEEANPRPVAQYFTAGEGTAVSFSPDSQWLAGGGKGRAVHLWRMETIRSGTPPVLLHGLPSSVGEVTMARDNSSVVAVAFGSVVRRWKFDGISGAAMPRHVAAAQGVAKSVVSHDGAWAAAARDGWEPGVPEDAVKGALVLTRLTGHKRLVLDEFASGATGVAFSRDGRWLAGCGRDATVKVWDFEAAARCADAGEPAPAPRHVIRAPDVRTTFQWSLTFHPDGRLFMVNGDGILFCWDLNAPDPAATEKREVIHSIRYLLPDVAISPNGKYLAAGRHGWDQLNSDKEQFGSQVLLFDVSARAVWPPPRLAILQSDFLEYTSIAFSPDNRWLASGGTGYAACLWDLHAPNIAASLRRPPMKSHLMSGISFSPDSQRLALGAGDGQLYLWDWQKAGGICSIQNAFGIKCITWMPDGRLLASGASDQLALWDTDLGRLQTLARRVAGRDLNSEERSRFRVP
jgi:WD40 repeat protein